MAELAGVHRESIILIAIFLGLFLSIDARAQTVSQVTCEPCFTISRQQFVNYDITTKTLTLQNPGVNCIIRDQIRIFGISSGKLSVPLGSIICGGQTYNISGVEPNTQLTISFEDSNYHIYSPGPDTATILVKYSVEVLFQDKTVSIERNKSTRVNFTIQNNQGIDDTFAIEASQIPGVSVNLQDTRLQVKANSSAIATMTVEDKNASGHFDVTLIARSFADGNVYGIGTLKFISIQTLIPTTTSTLSNTVQNQTNISSNEANVPPTLQTFVQYFVFFLALSLPVVFYVGVPKASTRFNFELSKTQRFFGASLVLTTVLAAYCYFFYSFILLEIVASLILGLLICAFSGMSTSCPKCGKWSGRKFVSSDIIDQKLFAHGTVTLYENHYVCKNCGHRWSTRSEKNKVRWGSDGRKRNWSKWLSKPVGRAPPSGGYRPEDFGAVSDKLH